MWTSTVKDIEHIVKQPDKLLTINENATVTQAAKKMSDYHIGCLVVLDMQGKFAGVLTERDMLAKVLTTPLSPDSVLVKNIMTADAVSCTLDTAIGKVEQLMAEHRIRHIPILDNGLPVGMVSSRDIIDYQLSNNKAMKTAAEQLALLSTGLKSFDFDDVITLAINQVPESFQAEYAVLCFAKMNSSPPIVYRKGCPLSELYLLDPEQMKKLSENNQVICDKVCDKCRDIGSRPPRIVIPLDICEHLTEHGSSNTINRPGFLCMCRFAPSAAGPEELRLYKASLLREVLSVNLTNARLYRNYRKARRDSQIDPLTNVGTRRFLEQVLIAEHERAVRYNHPFSIAIVDLDNFKQVNDNAGHAAGDRALRHLAKLMHQTVRKTDIIARYGGDEFVLLLPGTKLNEATILLERLRRHVKTISIPKLPPITVSCGIAEWSGSADDTPKTILKRADDALYEAKACGRNCVVTSRQTQKTT